jgi:hypothetical protein
LRPGGSLNVHRHADDGILLPRLKWRVNVGE